MHPVLGRYGPFMITSYEVLLGLGIASCAALMAWLTRDDPQQRRSFIDGLLFAIFAGLVGGRIVFVLSEWGYYSEQPGQIWLAWRGGLSYHGVLVAGLLTLWLWTRWRGQPFAPLAGLAAPLLALMSVIGWIACWFEGCAYGRMTDRGMLSSDLPDSYGVFELRYQTQLIGFALSLIVLVLALILIRRIRPMQLFWLVIALLASSRFIVTLYRGDAAPVVGAYRIDTIADGLMALIALIILVIIATLKLLRLG